MYLGRFLSASFRHNRRSADQNLRDSGIGLVLVDLVEVAAVVVVVVLPASEAAAEAVVQELLVG